MIMDNTTVLIGIISVSFVAYVWILIHEYQYELRELRHKLFVKVFKSYAEQHKKAHDDALASIGRVK